MKNSKINFIAVTTCLIIATMTSCGDSVKDDVNNDINKLVQEETDKAHVTKINGRTFSIPSPIQTAQLIQNSGAQYNNEYLHNPNEVSKYSTRIQKGLNLGVYGADLAYVNLYSQTQDAIAFLGCCKKLAEDLGVSGAFTEDLLKKFEKNLGNTDSLLHLASSAFQLTDEYLQSNENNDVGSLVLAGGWLEALYFSTEVYKNNPTEELKQRIAEQKFSINNLVKLLEMYSNGEDYGDLIASLTELSEIFEKLDVNYEYAKPEIDEENKIAIINSTTSIQISDEQIAEITSKVSSIRKNITE